MSHSSWKLLLIAELVLAFLWAHPPPTEGCEDGGVVALRYANLYFNQAMNTSLGMNATIWFQQQVNDSYWWQYNKNLTWAFTPNLAFWAFVEADFARISAAVAPDVPIEALGWGVPFLSEHPPPNHPIGFICDIGNGTYRYGGSIWNCLYGSSWIYPFPNEGPHWEGSGLREFNYTFVAQGAALLPVNHWMAEVWWNKTGLSAGQWTAIAEQFSARLNATWYLEACIVAKAQKQCPESDTAALWPFEALFLGLLVLVGLRSKRWRLTREGKKTKV